MHHFLAHFFETCLLHLKNGLVDGGQESDQYHGPVMLRLIGKFPLELFSGQSSRLYFRHMLEPGEPVWHGQHASLANQAQAIGIGIPLANQLSQPSLVTAQPLSILPEAYGEFVEAAPEEKISRDASLSRWSVARGLTADRTAHVVYQVWTLGAMKESASCNLLEDVRRIPFHHHVEWPIGFLHTLEREPLG